MNKIIYHFSPEFTEGNAEMPEILGGKGANLAQMCKIGLPIPPGFTVATNLCIEYYQSGRRVLDQAMEEIFTALEKLEKSTGKTFAAGDNPLLLSVRSGAKISMPGMMDTILNLGINEDSLPALAAKAGSRFAYDSYRRFLQMYGSVVLEVPHYYFEDVIEQYKNQANLIEDSELEAEHLCDIANAFKQVIEKYTRQSFPQDSRLHLRQAVESVLKSWMCQRAITYRKIQNIPDDIGTAVNIQAMVFGNLGDDSATGVVFTRNPLTGVKEIFGEYLINAQGEDVVAGIRTPQAINAIGPEDSSMQNILPKQYQQLTTICQLLERHYLDMQDIEFTIEAGKLYILQTRSGKRAASSAVKIAHDMVCEGLISKEQALLQIEPETINQLLHTRVDYQKEVQIIGSGLAASPGAAQGIIVFNATEAERLAAKGPVILVRNDTSPEDIKGMHVAKGILTARGGMTSHAAVVARGLGVPCICGVNQLVINEAEQYIICEGKKINAGQRLTIDGSSGKIIIGEVQLIEPQISSEFNTILQWADELSRMQVRVNAETVLDSQVALKFGAKGIGLCRTEHMFFQPEKLALIRQMILAEHEPQRQKIIAQLRPLQIADFEQLFEVMQGKAVNIRLLDPPLHEFLPHNPQEIDILAKQLNLSTAAITKRLQELQEANPMLGHRGCRLGISCPEIYIMQVEAIFMALANKSKESEQICQVELMVPLISEINELKYIKNYIVETIQRLEQQYKLVFQYKIGSMIELPRAALIADQIADEVDYFSFGSNDLTQTSFGISRDDINSFLPAYLTKKIITADPFVHIDEKGVGALIKIAGAMGTAVKPGLKLGVCGEHAGDPKSIAFFEQIGLDYISCSPYRLPIARIAAAQAYIQRKK